MAEVGNELKLRAKLNGEEAVLNVESGMKVFGGLVSSGMI